MTVNNLYMPRNYNFSGDQAIPCYCCYVTVAMLLLKSSLGILYFHNAVEPLYNGQQTNCIGSKC